MASGLVERGEAGGCVATPAGRVALEADEPTRWKRIAWPVVGGVARDPSVSAVVDWLS